MAHQLVHVGVFQHAQHGGVVRDVLPAQQARVWAILGIRRPPLAGGCVVSQAGLDTGKDV